MKFIVVLLMMVACVPKPAACAPRPDDPNGTLLAICRYIRDKNIDVTPADPTRYTIVRTEERAENGRRILRVFLNCCYLGDVADLDADTGEVLRFRAGAK